MALKFRFLTDNDPSFKAVWAWAKQLINDLNSVVNQLSSGGNTVSSGGLMMWPLGTAPLGWLICDGGSHAIADYPELYAQIGYTFGGAGANFNVPDYRNVLLMGAGTTVALNASAGSLTKAVAGFLGEIDSLDDINGSGLLSGFRSTTAVGGANSVNVLPPVKGVNFLIKT